MRAWAGVVAPHAPKRHAERAAGAAAVIARARTVSAACVVLALLAGVQLVDLTVSVPWVVTALHVVAALAIVAVARAAGLSSRDLGLGRGALRRARVHALAGALCVAVVYLLLLLLPPTRMVLLDERYRQPLGMAVLVALLVVPLRTVLLEELAFRGALWGLLRRYGGPGYATAVSSALFGLWHVPSALSLGEANRLVGATDIAGIGIAVVTVVLMAGAGAVLCELRRRRGSLFAPIAVHWSVNGLGVLAVAAAWALADGAG
jgi:uncharacterized protein